jgi:DNA-binding NarL/FixJ family response regulator
MPRPLDVQSHIVVIDAHPNDYRDMTLLAGTYNWNLHFLTTGAAALHFAPRGHPALWMINVRLPDMSGFDLVEMLRDEGVPGRVFAVADEYRAADESQACRYGADLYLCKDVVRLIDCAPILKTLAVENFSHSRRKHAGSHAGG